MRNGHYLHVAPNGHKADTVSPSLLPPDRQEIAGRVRMHLAEHGVLMMRLAGPPGAGKTTLVRSTVARLRNRWRVGAIVVNPAAARDAQFLRSVCHDVVSIDAAVPEPEEVDAAVDALLGSNLDIIFLEACGGIAPFPDVGEDMTVAVLGVSGGDDKAAEYRHLVSHASVVLLTKCDLTRYVRFNVNVFLADVARLNPSAPVLEICDGDVSSLDQWADSVEGCLLSKRHACSSGEPPHESEFYVG